MKNFLLLLITIPLFSFSQVNCDTVMIEPHGAEYTYERTRGYWFRANSSFTLSAVRAGDGNALGVNATHQSIEVIQFDGLNLFSDTIPDCTILRISQNRRKELTPEGGSVIRDDTDFEHYSFYG